MAVWMTVGHGSCECGWTCDGRNAMGLTAQHAKKTGHQAGVTLDYGIRYD